MNLGSSIPFPRLHEAYPISIHAVRPLERRLDSAFATMGSVVLLRILDQLDYGVMLVDPSAHVRFANRIARRDCSDAGVLRLINEQLCARLESDQQRLLGALSAAAGGRRSLLAVASSGGTCTLAITPVDTAETSTTSDPSSLVVFGRRQACEPLTVDFFAREHALTAAETSVLRHLANGRRPTDIAHDLGVAITTVRTQITSIRLKTGARNIGELVRLVTMLPPIVPVLGN